MKRHENPGEKPLLAKLDALRAVRGMTQDALERAAALPANKIAKWRSGTGEPKLREGLRLARALGVPIEFLADDDQREPVPGPDEDEVFLVKTIRELRISRNEAFKRLLAGGFGGPGFDQADPPGPDQPDKPRDGEPVSKADLSPKPPGSKDHAQRDDAAGGGKRRPKRAP